MTGGMGNMVETFCKVSDFRFFGTTKVLAEKRIFAATSGLQGLKPNATYFATRNTGNAGSLFEVPVEHGW
jgi:hypothetical protein